MVDYVIVTVDCGVTTVFREGGMFRGISCKKIYIEKELNIEWRKNN